MEKRNASVCNGHELAYALYKNLALKYVECRPKNYVTVFRVHKSALTSSKTHYAVMVRQPHNLGDTSHPFVLSKEVADSHKHYGTAPKCFAIVLHSVH